MKINQSLNIAFAIFFGLLTGYAMNCWINQQQISLLLTPVCTFETDKKEVVLSFDDGPGPATPALLEVLKKHQVKAVFFVLGRQINKYPEIAKQTVADGHIIANHSYGHKRMILRTYNYIEEDLLLTDSIIQSISPTANKLYRPPYGQTLFNLPRVLANHDKTIYNWSINSTAQYIQPYSKEKIVAETIADLHKGGIILLHDGWDYMPPELLVDVVDEIINQAQDLGYTFVLPEINTKARL